MTLNDFLNSPKSWSSRKLVFSAGTALLIFVGLILAAKWPSIGSYYGSLIGGLIAVLTIYTGGNVASSLVNGKLLNNNSESSSSSSKSTSKTINGEITSSDETTSSNEKSNG